MAIPSLPPSSPDAAADFLDQLEAKLRRRNERTEQRLLAWGELLDACGWCVAFALPGAGLWLSERAAGDLRERGGIPSDWNDLSKRVGAGELDREELKIWRSGTGAFPAIPDGLTRREREVLEWLRQGKTGPEISIILGCAQRTVEKHMANLYRKIGVTNRADAILAPSRPAADGV